MKNIMLYLTRNCNLDCVYCFAHHGKEELSFEMIKEIINSEMYDKNQKYNVCFFGGEPLLKKELIFDTVSYINERFNHNVKYSITTNGTLCDDEIFKLFKDNKFHITLSLDGVEASQDISRKTKDGKNTFKCIMRNADNWSNLNKLKPIYISMVVTPQNVKYFSESIKYLAEFGFRCITPEIDYYSDWNSESFDIYEQQQIESSKFIVQSIANGKYINVAGFNIKGYNDKTIKTDNNMKNKILCPASEKRLTFGPNGRIYPCYRFVGMGEEFEIGDIKNGELEGRREQLLERCEQLSKDLFNRTECGECKFKCQINCMALYFEQPKDLEWKICLNKNISAKVSTSLAELCCEYKIEEIFRKINKQ